MSTSRLSHNECPCRPSDGLIEKAIAELDQAHRYPDPDCAALRSQLAGHYGIAEAQISVGNGASELLYAAGGLLLGAEANLVYPWPSYYAYPKLAAINACEARPIELGPGDAIDLDRLVAGVDKHTELLIICNPNNPTGTGLDPGAVREAVAALPEQTHVLLDEAYCEFSSHGLTSGSVALLAAFPNLSILRTFSKAYGLAGLRIGYLMCADRAMNARMNAMRAAFSVNRVGLVAAGRALVDQARLDKHVARARIERDRIHAGLVRLGLSPSSPDANFVWTRLPAHLSDTRVAAAMAQRSVAIATGSELCEVNGLRCTAGLTHEVDRCLEALEEVLG